jgi:DNA-binding NarL/FixJ family response regulator
MEVVGEAESGREALELCGRLHPDVLILDIGLPELDGMQVTRALKKSGPAPRVLALSIHSEKTFITEALRAGADGYLVKSSAVDELVHAIRVVAAGKMYVSPEIAREALGELLAPEHLPALGVRERQVLGLLASGKRTAEIAAQLHISTATVEAHRRNIMRKLSLHTVADLTRYAIRHGLASL